MKSPQFLLRILTALTLSALLGGSSFAHRSLVQSTISVSDTILRIPSGTVKSIQVFGPPIASVQAIVSDPKVASAIKIDQGFKIRGIRPGTTLVTVSDGHSEEQVSVTVLPFASYFPQTLGVEVSGFPASASVVRGAVDFAVKTQLTAVSDARLSYPAVDATDLTPGQTVVYSLKVAADSPTSAPASGLVKVSVSNSAVKISDADYLWYSNDPETLKGVGPLFSATLDQGKVVRCLYHHMNGIMFDLYFRAELVNDTDETARIWILYGDAKPNQDPVRVGFQADCQFFNHWFSKSGEVVTLPPRSVIPISFRRLSPGETASGLCELELLSGPKQILARADALPPLTLDTKWNNTIFTCTPWHEVGAHPINTYDKIPFELNTHIYANPHFKGRLTYSVGGPTTDFRIGERRLVELDGEGSLDGNYGVIDSIDTLVTNPTAVASDVELVFEASAGYGAGLFLIDGHLVTTKLLGPKGTDRVLLLHLEPGATKHFSIKTFPFAGASYPATLFLRQLSASGAN